MPSQISQANRVLLDERKIVGRLCEKFSTRYKPVGRRDRQSLCDAKLIDDQVLTGLNAARQGWQFAGTAS
jgi:hypothetical protein